MRQWSRDPSDGLKGSGANSFQVSGVTAARDERRGAAEISTIRANGEASMATRSVSGVTDASKDASSAPLASLLAGKKHHEHDHVVRFYTEDNALIDTITPIVAVALQAGDAAVIIATRVHRDGLAQRLHSVGVDTASAAEQGRYVALDAEETLAKFMVEEWPNDARFADVIGEVIEQARKAAGGSHARVIAFGEMVALLWNRGRIEATLRLEQLWNELAKTHAFSLCCAYPMAPFDRREHSEPFQKICAEHSHVVPGHGYADLLDQDDRMRAIARLEQKNHALEVESALRESEEHFQLLVESVQDYAIFMLDPAGRVSTWNVGAQRIKGYAASEIIGKHFSCFYSQDDIDAGKPKRELEVAAAEGRFEDEGWRLRKDGSRFWANVIVTALHDNAGRLCGFSKITRDITERMRAHEALRETNTQLAAEIAERIVAERKLHRSEQSLRNLSGQLLRAQDEERRRFGRELHDSVGQCLAVLKMGMDSLRSDVPKDRKETERQLGECLGLAEQAIREVRTISYLLHPPMLEEMGLSTAIAWYLDGFGKRSGIETTLELIPPEFGRLPRDIELALFRVLQESLTNVHRHSGSPTAHVRMAIGEGSVTLEIRDDGKGIPPGVLEMDSDALGEMGVGLRGMNERMRQLGGRLELDSGKNGTTIRAIVPYEASASAVDTSD
jgi:PAS domain S-box-containing protein